MQDLISLLLLITAFGGLGIIGVLILASGFLAAERTSAIMWCAAVAAMLFAVQLGWIAFWHSFGVGFGGEDIQGRTVLQWGGVTAVVLVGGFLAWKLPSAVEQAVEEAKWWRDGARVSALIVVAYVLYFVGGILLRWASRPGVVPPPAAAWIIMLAGLLLAWGLWRHRRWAWYAALVCAIYAIARIVWFAWPKLPADAPFLLISTPAGVRLLLLGLLLGALLFSNARRLCAVQKTGNSGKP
jgi:translocator protein